MNQSTFNPSADNAELMLADFYIGSVEPAEPDIEEEITSTAAITYSGVTATIKVGGSAKTFTPVFSLEGVIVTQWLVSDENGDISSDTDNYTIEREGELLKLRVSQNYYLIGKVLKVQVIGSDGSNAEVQIGIVG